MLAVVVEVVVEPVPLVLAACLSVLPSKAPVKISAAIAAAVTPAASSSAPARRDGAVGAVVGDCGVFAADCSEEVAAWLFSDPRPLLISRANR